MVGDNALLERFAARRDSDAFNELVRRYSGLVYGTCLRVTGNHDDAQVVTQECFFELARRAHWIRCSLPGWLHKLARNRSVKAIISSVRQMRREQEAINCSLDSVSGLPNDLASQLDDAVESLPEQLRLPIVTYYLSGYSQDEIAKELGLSQVTVSRLLERGLSELRKRLQVVIPVALLAVFVIDTAAQAAPAFVTAEQRIPAYYWRLTSFQAVKN